MSRRSTETDVPREECLRRATEYQWLAENAPSEAGAAQAWDQARFWRSLALVARPTEPKPS